MSKICNPLLHVLIFGVVLLQAQTNIGGVINTYTVVTSIGNSGCASTITVTNPAGFASGDKVLIIQMKGAVIDSTDSNVFGNITNLNGAGNYEFSRIASVTGNNILLNNILLQSYFIPGFVQLVRVPEYVSANVTSVLQAQAWNGATGGILSFFVTGNLSLNADMNVTGQGFRGGNISNNPDGSCGSGSPGYFYPLTQPGTSSWNFGGAMKGEGIAVLNDDKMAGKGKLADGGGGGNKHNHGGGGGGNFTAGGQGGEALEGCQIDGNMGVGGLSLATDIQNNKLFLGGGGGCGDYNNAVGSNGANGGGIVIVRSGSITGNGHSILANGDDEIIIGGGIADGVGGGGGGGIIFLDVASYSGNLSLTANGGYGGDQDPTYGCVGTGGGGGTGEIITTQSSLPGSVSVATLAGRAGIFVATNTTSCVGSSYYATPGQDNLSGALFGKQFIEGTGIGSMLVALGNDTSLCVGDVLQLNPNINNATYLWQDGSTQPVFNVSVAGLYWVQITSGLCSGRDSIVVSYFPKPTIGLGNDTTLCAGENLVLNQNGIANNFLWQDNSIAQLYNVTQPGLYILDASNNGCHVKDSILVGYVNLNINLGNDTSLCTGDTLLLSPGLANVSYLWQDGGTLPFYRVSSAGQYKVQVTSGTCSAGDSVQINYVVRPAIELGNDTTLCTGYNLALNQNGIAANFLWQDNSIAQVYNVTQPGLYILDASNGGCHVKDSILIAYVSLNIHLGNDTSLCAGDILQLNPGVTNVSYLWQDGSILPVFDVSVSGLYWAQISNGVCNARDSVVINYFLKPVIELGNDTTLCPGDNLALNQNGIATNFLWQDNSTAQVYNVTQAGLYILDASNNGCHLKDSVSVGYVNLNIDLGKDTVICDDSHIELFVSCIGCTYLWNTGATENSISVNESGTYSVNVQSVCGVISDSIRLTAENCTCILYFPNAFTPNGDGNNDELRPLLNCNWVFYRLKIFNRWGEKVFESNNPNIGWDGNYKGKNSPGGVYVYELTYSGDEGVDVHTYNLKGSVTLIR